MVQGEFAFDESPDIVVPDLATVAGDVVPIPFKLFK